MKKALSMLLAGTMAMSLVACSSGNSSSSTTADTTTAAAAADTKSEGGDTAADRRLRGLRRLQLELGYDCI